MNLCDCVCVLISAHALSCLTNSARIIYNGYLTVDCVISRFRCRQGVAVPAALRVRHCRDVVRRVNEASRDSPRLAPCCPGVR